MAKSAWIAHRVFPALGLFIDRRALFWGEFGIRTRALNTALFDNPQCGFYFVGSILKKSWVPNCHLKLRGKAIDILPLGARLKKYGHLKHPHISTTNHLGHDNSRP